MIKRKQLSVNYDKSKYLLIGSQKFRNEMLTRLVSKAEEIIQVSEMPMMNGNGNSLAAFKLYETQVIPAFILNSEIWIG